MNKFVKPIVIGLVAGAALGVGQQAFADEVFVRDVNKIVTKQIPHTEKVCNTVEVPIYGGGGGASTFDKLGGAIIGGAIGNQFGNGSGKDAMTVLGAIAGADIAGKKMDRGAGQIIGYRQEQRCSKQTTYTEETYEVYSHSFAEFNHNGRFYRIKFVK